MNKIVIKVENLGKRYNIGSNQKSTTIRDGLVNFSFKNIFNKPEPEENFWALKDVGFQVREGEILGVIGANGSGKSTLLKIISQITPPTEGKVEIVGRVASLLEVGTGFHPDLTGRENIYLNGAILGMKQEEVKRKFDQIVEFSEIGKFLDSPVKHYSSGMYVRLAFSIAVHLDSEILIMDEVLAVGDAQFQKKCLTKMAQISKERTILFVSHNAGAVKSLCDRAILLKDGHIIMEGRADKVVDSYIGKIETEQQELFEQNWPKIENAPTNGIVTINGVSVCDGKGELVKKVRNNTAINIEIDYKVNKDFDFIGLSILFYDKNDVCLISSLFNDNSKWYGRRMETGTYRSICHIPASFFNDCYLNIGVGFFGKNFNDHIVKKDLLRFQVINDEISPQKYNSEYLPTVFKWETIRK